MSKVYFRFGAMNSGKTTSLLQVAFNYEERGQKVLLVKPTTDTKGDQSVQSRLGMERAVDWLVSPEDSITKNMDAIHEKIDCILVDEAQFITSKQVDEFFEIAVLKEIPVIAYGIRGDFQTKSFPGSLRLLELAHSLEEIKTICRCGKKALFNGRKTNGVFVQSGNQVEIDGVRVEYESLCGKCYIKRVGQIQTP